jgi:transcription antitermination protein NusB
VLYQSELNGLPLGEVLQRYASNPGHEFASVLAKGVAEHQTEIDELIESRAKDWSLERMPVLDLILLRIALFEMLHLPEVPPAAAINEAVELAKIYSTEDSSRFINGVLGAIAAKT